MGIDREWKNIIGSELFGKSLKDNYPDNFKPETIIEDLSGSIRGFGNFCSNAEDLKKSFFKNIAFRLTSDVHTYIGLVDEGSYIPKNKSIEQKKRDSKNSHLTPDEEANFIVDSSQFPKSVDPADKSTPSSRVYNTRGILPRLFSYLCYKLSEYQPQIPKSSSFMKIVIDGPAIEYTKSNFNTLLHSENIQYDNSTIEYLGSMNLDSMKINGDKGNSIYTFNWQRIDPSDDKSRLVCKVNIKPSQRIGEGDLKWSNHLLRLRDHTLSGIKDVLYVTKDTDSIPISLLSMTRFFDKTRDPHFRLVIDLSPNQEMIQLICVNDLWMAILNNFQSKLPEIEDPIETVCFMMIFTGSDFVTKPSGIGAGKIWEYFLIEGWKWLFKSINVYGTMENSKFNGEAPYIPTFCHEILLGSMKNRRKIRFLNVFRLAKFVVNMYLAKSKKVVRCHENTKVIPKNIGGVKHPPYDEIIPVLRRIQWNLDYWLNGGRIVTSDTEERFLNPSIKCESGLSVSGWDYNEKTGEFSLATKVSECDIYYIK